jgi:hypothetical protein
MGAQNERFFRSLGSFLEAARNQPERPKLGVGSCTSLAIPCEPRRFRSSEADVNANYVPLQPLSRKPKGGLDMPGGHPSKTSMGQGSQGKGSGTGANTIGGPRKLDGLEVLSNRDKAQHSKARGQDSKAIESEQEIDNG